MKCNPLILNTNIKIKAQKSITKTPPNSHIAYKQKSNSHIHNLKVYKPKLEPKKHPHEFIEDSLNQLIGLFSD